MENNKNKKSVKFQGDMFNFCDFIQVFVFTRNHHLKVVISGKYKNLNNITKIKNTFLKFHRLLIFSYSPQFTMQNRGICCLKKCFNTERSKRNFVRENLKK